MTEVNLQQLYEDILGKKEQRKTIKSSIKDHYDNSPIWKKISESLKEVKDKKKVYDNEIKAAYTKDFDEIFRLSQEIQADEELLSDLCFQEMMQNRTVEIKDPKGNTFEPVVKVVLRKR